MDIFQKSITPDKPRVLAEEQIYVYVPMATSTNAGIASYNRDQFDIIGSEVSLKWPAESFTQGPIETPSIVKVLDNEFEYTGNIVDLISGNNRISSDKLEVQLKRILRDAYDRPDLVMLDPNYFVRTITEKDGKQYYKYNTTAIHYNMSQNLSEAEQAQARTNISASSISDNDATNERIDTIEINITNLDNKQNLDVITDISITGTGDNRYITSTTKNIKTQVVSTDNDQLTLASDTRAGLMSVSDYRQLRTNTSKLEQLENKTARLIYDGKSNPTASDINNFAVGEGYEPPFAGLSVVVADTYHIWHYYANIGWKDDGLDIVQQFTNTTAGVIIGSELDGKIYAETDGTASVNGWGDLTGLVSSIDINMTNHINDTQNPHNVTKTQVGLSNVDNTSDIDKPISTAVQSALDAMLPRSEAPTKVSDLQNDAAYIKNNDRFGCVQIPYIYNVARIYSVEDKDHLYDDDGKTQIDLHSDYIGIYRHYPNTYGHLPAFKSERDGVRDVTSIQSYSTKRLIVDGVEEPTFPSNGGGLSVVSEDDGSYIEATLNKLTVVQDEDGSNRLHQDSKSLIFNWNGLYLNNNEISPNTIRYDIEQTLTDEQKARARANIGAGTGGGTGGGTSGGGTVVTVGGVAQETWDADAKLDKGFTKTVGDTKITVSMNPDDTPGIVAGYKTSDIITHYVASLITEDKTITQYISGEKADGTIVYNVMHIAEDDILIGASSDTGQSSVDLTPDKIEINTTELTYNGNEVATTLYVDNLIQAVNNKADLDYVDQKVAALIGAAPETLDTLEELATAFEENADVVKTLEEAIVTKVAKTDVENFLSATSINPVQNKVITKALEEKVDKVDGKGLSTNDFTNDYKSQVENNTTARHAHNNKTLLDTYTQTETNLADAVAKKHAHNNKEILDGTTASYTTDNALSVTFAEKEREKSKNLFDYTRVKSLTNGITQEGGIFTINTQFYYPSINYDINLNQGETYTFSLNIDSYSNSDGSGVNSELVLFSATGQTDTKGVGGVSNIGRYSMTFTPSFDVVSIEIRLIRKSNNTSTLTGTVSNLMLCVGEDSDYQPYNGAIVHDKQLTEQLSNYLPLSGGTMTGPVILGQGDTNALFLGSDGRINAGTSGSKTLFGLSSLGCVAGQSDYALNLRGSQTRPSYNGVNLALTSDISMGDNFTTYTVIDATALDENTWYPVTFDAGYKNLKIMLFNQWNGGNPSWATHSSKNYGCVKIWETTGHAWGELDTYRRIHLSVFAWTSTDPVRGVGQLGNRSIEYVYVRGGGKYNFYTSHNVVPVLRTSTYTVTSQSVAPTTTAPAEIVQTIMSTDTAQTISGAKTFSGGITCSSINLTV